MEKFIGYSIGITSMSACVDNSLSGEEIEELANTQFPTEIESKWTISSDTHFRDGINTNPCPCQDNPETRSHYLLNC